MNKILIIVFMLISMLAINGCRNETKDIPFGYATYEIDNCEYIATQSAVSGIVLTHKGNCKNPIHKQENK